MSEIELHRKLLGDRPRNAAFAAALQQRIEPGHTQVLDIGGGTGFLSFLARQLGAASVTMIEYTDALELAEELARRNTIDGLSFIKAHSSEVRRKLSVDLVVTETLGNYALEENLLETAIDARRFIKPGGTLIPGRVRQFVAPVLEPRLQQEIDIWPDIGFGLDFAPARTLSLNNMYVRAIQPRDLGGDDRHAQCWDDLNLLPEAKAPPSDRSRTLDWPTKALAGARVHGLALWWEAELIPGVTISTSPLAPPTHWEQIYLPLLTPLSLEDGDQLQLTLSSDTRVQVGVRVRWAARVLRKGRKLTEQSLDSWRGRL